MEESRQASEVKELDGVMVMNSAGGVYGGKETEVISGEIRKGE